MPIYETVFMARQDLTPQAVEELTKAFTGFIEAGEGKVIKTESWGLKNLSYRIQKNRKAHFVLLELDTPAPALIEMERNMRLNEDVLRYLSIKLEKATEGPSVMMKGGRDDERPSGDRNERPSCWRSPRAHIRP